MLEKLPEALGAALDTVRAGLTRTVFHASGLRQGLNAVTVGSLAFADHAPLPRRCTADGEGVSPPLHWSGVPAAATEWALIVEDADSPTPMPLVHAIAHGPAGADGSGALAEGALGGDAGDDAGSGDGAVSIGRNSLLGDSWLPPDPPPGHGVHRYVFQVFALGAGAPLPEAPGREALTQAVQQRAIASGCLVGTYERSTRIATGDAAATSGAAPV